MKIFPAFLCMATALVATPIAPVVLVDAGHPVKNDGASYVGADRIGLQHAAWALLDPDFAADGTAQKWIIEASKEFGTVDLAGFAIVSEVAGYKGARKQEFLTAASPEPFFINFFGGLIAIGLVLLGRRRG